GVWFRAACAASARSMRPRWRSTPYTSSDASLRSRSSSAARASSPSSAGVAHALSRSTRSSTRRAISRALVTVHSPFARAWPNSSRLRQLVSDGDAAAHRELLRGNALAAGDLDLADRDDAAVTRDVHALIVDVQHRA